MYIIVGLGNPGNTYTYNRHNVGFMCADFIKMRNSFDDFKKKDNYLFTRGLLGGHEVVLVKPQTFMNLSGQGLTKAMSFFKVPTERVVIIHDDIALPFGKIRIRESGTPGGHNGLKSIERELGTKEYKRVRIGVDAPEMHGVLADFVLGNFSKEQLLQLDTALFADVENVLQLIVNNEIKRAMNEYNGKSAD